MDDVYKHKFQKLIESERDSPTTYVPCNDCLCLGICKHKSYTDLRDCHIVENYIYMNRILYGNPASCLRLIKVAKLFKNPIWKDELIEFLEIDETDYQIFF
jgi:hypothetical protein